jgi:thiamine kinase-like enzyme
MVYLTVVLAFRLLEQWRRDAVLSLLSSQLEKTQSWNQLFHWVLDASKNVVSTVSDILNRLKTEEALKLIFGHFDCNTSNIIVCGGLEKADVVLIDEEWAGPNVAVYDFAKFVTSSSLMVHSRIRRMMCGTENTIYS